MDVRNRDQFMDEKHRRRTGAFFTPKLWVDEAHKMMDQQLGPNWREEYVVWDASAGTANLTRDYRFKELYLSTLEQTDVDIILKSGFNPGAVVFQFDFLNDPIEDSIIGGPSKLPEGLKKALEENRPIVFLNNPPYGTSSDYRALFNNIHKEKIDHTEISKKMKEERINGSSNLMAQFIWGICNIPKIFKLSVFSICTFSQLSILTIPTYKKIRIDYLNNLNYKSGFIFPSTDFIGNSANWPVLFSIFSEKNNLPRENNQTIKVNIKNTNTLKTIHNNDYTESEFEWVSLKNITSKKQGLSLSSALTVNEKYDINIPVNSFGFYSIMNTVAYESKNGIFSSGVGSIFTDRFCISPENFEKCISSVSSRMVLNDAQWYEMNDIFLKPDVNNILYQQWVNDSIIISIFNLRQSQISSLRQVTYHNSLWDLENHFFYLSNQEMRDLANQHNNTILYQDTFKYPNDRFVYNKLQSLQGQFSPDAQAVLDKAIELTRLSFPYRKDADPKFHLNAWDAGWYQIRMGILKEHFPKEYSEFRELLLVLRKRMAPLVYELGFLKR